MNSIPESLPADKIVIFCAKELVTDPPEANTPPRTNAALFPTAAATEIPSASAAMLYFTAVIAVVGITVSTANDLAPELYRANYRRYRLTALTHGVNVSFDNRHRPVTIVVNRCRFIGETTVKTQSNSRTNSTTTSDIEARSLFCFVYFVVSTAIGSTVIPVPTTAMESVAEPDAPFTSVA